MADTQRLEFTPNDKFRKLIPFLSNGTRSKKRENIDTICLHWSAGFTLNDAVSTLRSKGYGYHFFIEGNGMVTQGEEVDRAAAHAGVSFGPQGLWLNNYSIGVSFVKRGSEKAAPGSTQFSETEVDACARLILDLKLAMPQLKWITGHQWVSPRRKVDPYTFPFENLVKRLNLTMKQKKMAGPEFQIWRTGDGIGGDPDNYTGLNKSGTELYKIHKGDKYRFDKGYLTSAVANANESDLSPSVADADDIELAANGDASVQIDSKGLVPISPASSEQVKISSFGKITNYS